MRRTTTNIYVEIDISISRERERERERNEIYRLIKMSFYQIELIIFDDKIL